MTVEDGTPAYNYALMTWDGVLDLAGIYLTAMEDPEVRNGEVAMRDRSHIREQHAAYEQMHAPRLAIDTALSFEQVALRFRQASTQEAALAVLAILDALRRNGVEGQSAREVLAAARLAGPPITLAE